MFQIAGLPARIIITANTKFAYFGHIVTEVYYEGKWGVTDPTSGAVIKNKNGAPASAWEIHNSPDAANRIFYQNNPEAIDESYYFFSPGEQYESVGISNYYIDESKYYSYETSKVNEYCRKILKHSDEKWEGGVRWVHGEDFL
jgi:hypothetical protein